MALDHTADVILEAWAPDVAGCCEEAVAALVGTYCDATDAVGVGDRVCSIASGPMETMLLALLDEVIFLLDTAEGVPVGATVKRRGDGSLEVAFVLAAPGSVEPTGPVPKAIARSAVRFEVEPHQARCSFVVDL